jgi:hypothetical protein
VLFITDTGGVTPAIMKWRKFSESLSRWWMVRQAPVLLVVKIENKTAAWRLV